ncbi:thioesterase family protein [Pontitalea aquivivens]|uniref:thioesterase family protein n=1 Tax=Pontitalea aquivivens TaxID=3388663 RepID=UPI003970FDD8
MTEPAPPFSVTFRGQVDPHWIDVNRHMSAGFYDQLFDRSEETLFTEFGIADPYILRTGLSYYRLERLVVYARELMQGDPLEVRSRVLWTDLRRVHHFHELWNTAAGYRAACADGISIHVDLTTRKSVVATLPEVTEPLIRLCAAHCAHPLPEGVVHRVDGRRVGP